MSKPVDGELEALHNRLASLEQDVQTFRQSLDGWHNLMRLYAALRAIELKAPEPEKIASETLKAVFPEHYGKGEYDPYHGILRRK